jgi:hypothetical protein
VLAIPSGRKFDVIELGDREESGRDKGGLFRA